MNECIFNFHLKRMYVMYIYVLHTIIVIFIITCTIGRTFHVREIVKKKKKKKKKIEVSVLWSTGPPMSYI